MNRLNRNPTVSTTIGTVNFTAFVVVALSLVSVGVAFSDTILDLWSPTQRKVAIVHYQGRKMATAAPMSFAVSKLFPCPSRMTLIRKPIAIGSKCS